MDEKTTATTAPPEGVKCPLCVDLPHLPGVTFKEQMILFGFQLGLMAVMTSNVWTCQRHATLIQKSTEHAKAAVQHRANQAADMRHRQAQEKKKG